MASAQEIFSRAIREDKGVSIFLTSDPQMEGCIPLHVRFLGGGYPLMQETKHHDKSEDIEIELDVNEACSPRMACLRNNPSVEFKVRGIFGILGKCDFRHEHTYAYLSVDVFTCWEDEILE